MGKFSRLFAYKCLQVFNFQTPMKQLGAIFFKLRRIHVEQVASSLDSRRAVDRHIQIKEGVINVLLVNTFVFYFTRSGWYGFYEVVRRIH